MRIKRFIFPLFISMFFLMLLPFDVHADGGGAVIGTGANHSSGTATSIGGQAPPFNGTSSWIFYKRTNNDFSDGWMLFTPDSDVWGNSNENWIDPECADHKDGGFWHYGNDAYSGYYVVDWYGYTHYDFGIAAYLQDYDSDYRGFRNLYRYETGRVSGSYGWGHFYSYDYDGSRPDYSGDSWMLKHRLYKNNSMMYYADYYDNPNDTSTSKTSHNVLTNYKQAYRQKYGKEYTKNDMPHDVWYFCWWPGLAENKTLTAQAVDTKGNLISEIPDVTDEKEEGSAASVTRNTNEAWTFKGWKEAASPSATTKVNYVNSTSGARYISGSGTSPAKIKYNVSSLKSNYTVYAVYEKKQFTLTAKAVDTSGKPISSYIPDQSVTKPYGELAPVTRGTHIAYKFKGWKEASSPSATTKVNFVKSESGAKYISGNGTSPALPTYNIKAIKASGTIYAIYERIPAEFNGRSRAAGAGSSVGWSDIASSNKVDTGWYNKVAAKGSPYTCNDASKGCVTYYYECQDPVNGCDVSLRHMLYQSSGYGSVKYKIEQVANFDSLPNNAKPNNSELTENFTASSVGKEDGKKYHTVRNQGFKLKPGQIVCETLKFMPKDTGKKVGDASTTSCISVIGNAQPPDPSDPDTPEDPNKPSGDSSLINIKVRNETLGTQYQRTVYAKPVDKIIFRATYNPVLQYTYSLIPEKMQINGSKTITTNTGKSQLGALFNSKNGCSSNVDNCWNNAFGLSSDFSNNTKYNYAKRYTLGDTAFKSESLDSYSVTNNNVGKKLNETVTLNSGNKVNKNGTALVTSNKNISDKITPRQVSFSNSSNNNLGNVITNNSPSRIATVIVPYNYNNSTKITDNANKTIYAGEKTDIGLSYIINPRNNPLTTKNTSEKYATDVNNPHWKLEYCIGEGCVSNFTVQGQTDYKSSTNADEFKVSDKDSGKSVPKTESVIVPDVNAGTKFCVRSAIYPKDSGPNDNIDPNYYNVNNASSWKYSNPVCFVVAKKPSLQILGGSIYSNGNIKTAVSKKVLLSGGYPDTTTTNQYLFGSWGELGVISRGTVEGLASGAGLSTELDNSNIRVKSFIVPCPLSFANAGCNSNSIASGSIGSSSIMEKPINDKEAIIKKFDFSNATSLTNGSLISDPNYDILEYGQHFYYNNGDITVNASTVGKRTTHIIKSENGTIKIAGNITYSATDPYNTYDDMPKVVFYAKNIVIECGVSRIDGLLIAEESVVTCNNFENNFNDINNKVKSHINDRVNSNRLQVNGAIVTSKIILNRTYGGATGNNSGVPAEIINFDPSLYRWNSEKIQSSEDAKASLEAVQTRELAPRL